MALDTTVLEFNWVQALYGTYDDLCWRHRVPLKRPVIALADTVNKLGEWDGETRVLRISRNLIREHPWDAVISVLRHEMAHQLSNEVWGRDDGHGPLFLRACERMGVPFEYCGASMELSESPPDWRQQRESDPDEARLRRVERLLALAQSASENEALLAMERVHDLYARYNLERIQARKAAPFVHLTLILGRQQVSRLKKKICSLLTAHYFVSVIFGESFDASTGEKVKAAELLGTRQNVLMAEYVFHFLLERAESLWLQYRKGSGVGSAAAKSAFQIGLVEGFERRLEGLARRASKASPGLAAQGEVAARSGGAPQGDGVTHADAQDGGNFPLSEEAALILKDDPALADFEKRRHPRLRRIGSAAAALDATHYGQGVHAGKNLVLHKGVKDGGKAAAAPLRLGAARP